MKKSPLWLAVFSAVAFQSAFSVVTAQAAVVSPQTQMKTLSAAAVVTPQIKTIQTRELLTASELVFSGKVASIEYKDSIDGIPHTFVTYDIDQVISGQADGSQITLRFMGGRQQKGDVIRYLDVSESPKFRVGDHDILFTSRNNHSICPLAQCASGRFRNVNGILASDDGRAVIAKSANTYALSSVVIAEHHDDDSFGHGASGPGSEAREPVVPAAPAAAVKVDQFVAELHVEAREVANLRPTPPVFTSASIKADFRAAPMTPVAAPKDAPALLKRGTTVSDFDRWEAEAVRKNNGNPVL